MTVTAPPLDTAGAALDAQIAVVQALVNANKNPAVLAANKQLLNQLQVEAVDHYMVTFWLDPTVILATYQPLATDKIGQSLLARVVFLQNLVNNAPTMPTGNADGYGAAGWTTVLQNYQSQLYAAQVALVERLMDCPGSTSAATMLANLTGFQTRPYDYVFSSVGFTDQWIDG